MCTPMGLQRYQVAHMDGRVFQIYHREPRMRNQVVITWRSNEKEEKWTERMSENLQNILKFASHIEKQANSVTTHII